MRRAHCTVLSVSHWLKAWELRTPLFEAQQDAAAAYTFLKRGSGEGAAEFFSLVSSDKTCGNSSKMSWGDSDWTLRSTFSLRG